MQHNAWQSLVTAALAASVAGTLGCSRSASPPSPPSASEPPVAKVALYTNQLIREKSPYLLQHAHNPVKWYPWGEEAFARARAEKKPIFLSIGYSTCHWCHIMARESFENEDIAGILNEFYIPIMVDREERPDVEGVYMAYLRAATGGGGWPMSVWLTPDLKPIMGGTYYPPADNWDRPGFKSVLLRVSERWKNEQSRILADSDLIMKQLRDAVAVMGAPAAEVDPAVLDATYSGLKAAYDPRHGGFGSAPKFPRPAALNFLFRYFARSLRQGSRQAGGTAALDMALLTLRKMAEGGMCDHLGGGFHRYSVDERWHVPHFEKALSDQAQLVVTYLDAYQITREDIYAEAARGILDYVRRDLTGDQGQFYTAQDADSAVPGNPQVQAEGAFYVWTQSELARQLGREQAGIFAFRYGVEADGNIAGAEQGDWKGKNVLAVAHGVGETATRFNRTADEIRSALAEDRRRLLEVRSKRPRPLLDDKVITAWNGLMISGFARASQVFGDDACLASARAAAEFVRQRLYDGESGMLKRRHRLGEAAIDGYLDDYAFLIQGLLDLYETGFEADYLAWAIALQQKQDALFWDADAGGYFSTDGQDESILLRMKEGYDGTEPSPNSVAVMNLARLAQMTGQAGYAEKADRTIAAFGAILKSTPQALPQMMAGFEFRLDKPKQIVLAGRPDAPDTAAMIRAVHERYLPNKILLLADGGAGQATLSQYNEFMKNVVMVDGKATVYVCENFVCQFPSTNHVTLASRLAATGLSPDGAPR